VVSLGEAGGPVASRMRSFVRHPQAGFFVTANLGQALLGASITTDFAERLTPS
jgi:hypothetical protein